MAVLFVQVLRSQLSLLHHLTRGVNISPGQIPGVVIVLPRLFMLGTILLDILRVPFVNKGEIQVFIATGALANDAYEMEIRRLLLRTIKLFLRIDISHLTR